MAVYPPRNLPGLAEQWGRAVERKLESIDSDFTQLSQSSNNSDRANSGQLAVLSAAITELQERRSYSTTPADLSVTGTATTAPFPNATRAFTLPAPEGSRVAMVGFSAELANTGGNTNPVNAFVELLYGSTVVARTDGGVPRAASAPAGWYPTVNFFTFLNIPSGSDPSFSVRLTRVGFTSASTTLSLQNMTAYVQYGDLV